MTDTYFDILPSSTLTKLNDISWGSNPNLLASQLLLDQLIQNLNNEEDEQYKEEERIRWNGWLKDFKFPFRLSSNQNNLELRSFKLLSSVNNTQISKLIREVLNTNYFQCLKTLFYNNILEKANSNLRILETNKGLSLVEISNPISLDD